MPELFATYDREGQYTDRLRALVDGGRAKFTPADVKAVACLLEERARLMDLLDRVRRMRKAQVIRDRALNAGVSRAQGLEQATHEAGQLESVVDRQIAEELPG